MRTHFYSNKAIKEMIENGLSEDFADYLAMAPSNVRRIIESWGYGKAEVEEPVVIPEDKEPDRPKKNMYIVVDNTKKKKNKASKTTDTKAAEPSIQTFEQLEFELEPELPEKIIPPQDLEEPISEPEMEIIEEDEPEEEIIRPSVPSQYENLTFKDRIDVDVLYIRPCDRNRCPFDKNQLKTIQVVVHYGNNKKYGGYYKCCDKCKLLFCRRDEIQELEDDLIEKGIKFVIEEGNDHEEEQ